MQLANREKLLGVFNLLNVATAILSVTTTPNLTFVESAFFNKFLSDL